jgi:AcrR family transcriptional regulator
VSARPPASARIVSAARRHFLAHGFRNVTMDELAGELGMSKKTLYAHFRDKDALVEAALADKVAELEAELAAITTTHAGDFAEALHRLAACLQRHTSEIQPPFIRDMRRAGPDLFKRLETRRAGIIEKYFGKLFEQGRRSGMIRSDLPARLVIEVLLAAVHTIMNPPKIAELRLTPRQGLDAILSVVLHGAMTEKGRSA